MLCRPVITWKKDNDSVRRSSRANLTSSIAPGSLSACVREHMNLQAYYSDGVQNSKLQLSPKCVEWCFSPIFREELAVAQATIQALQKRVTDPSEDSASPGASESEAEAAILGARLRQAKDQLATSSTKNEAMQVNIIRTCPNALFLHAL